VLGSHSFVGHHATIAAHERVEIGPGAYLAELVSIRDHDHRPGVPPRLGEVEVAPVVIGEDVWIAAKATVLRGCSIGEGTVVGANAVASGDLPPRSLAVGVPARVIRTFPPDEA
jgi:acetyltransferase-like isoleucine patch superfamily enzyme